MSQIRPQRQIQDSRNDNMEPMSSKQNSASSLFSLSKRDYSSSSGLFSPGDNSGYFDDNELKQPHSQAISFHAISNYYNKHVVLPQAKVEKFVFILVGLPASGKSTMSKYLIEYLANCPTTASLRCSIFNAGKFRRQLETHGYPMKLACDSSEDLFSPKNTDKKEKYARMTLDKLLDDIDNDLCDIAIFDATNSTVERRSFIFSRIGSYNILADSHIHITPIVLQLNCHKKSFIKFNIHNKTFNEDYFDKPYEYAVSDFAKRFRYYCSQFTPFNATEFESTCDTWFLNSGLHNGLLYFDIADAGSDSEKHVRLQDYCSVYSLQVIKIIKDFIAHFQDILSEQYVKEVQNFFNDRKNSEKLSSLNKIVNDQYFETLQYQNNHYFTK